LNLLDPDDVSDRVVVLGPDDLYRAADLDSGIQVLRAERAVFGDGEHLLVLPSADRVRGRHVLVVQTTSPPQDQRFLSLLQLVDIVAAARAATITCFTPYLCYQRQDRRTRLGEALTARVLLRSLAAMGARSLMSVDRHSDLMRLPGEVPVTDLTVAADFADLVRSAQLGSELVVSPDAGGTARAERTAALLDLPVVTMSKLKRPDRGTYYEEPVREVLGRRCLVVEDLCSTGTTLVPLCAWLQPRVERIDILVTHILTSVDTIAARLPAVSTISYSDSCGDPRAPVHVLPAAITAWTDGLAEPTGRNSWHTVS
jgi:ribose-phosphate pyrophosphokinase